MKCALIEFFHEHEKADGSHDRLYTVVENTPPNVNDYVAMPNKVGWCQVTRLEYRVIGATLVNCAVFVRS